MDRFPATYWIGQHIHIYYNPANPEESVIKRGLTTGALSGLSFIVFAIIGAMGMVVF